MKHVLVYGMTHNPGGIESYLMGLFRRVQDTQVHFDFVSDFPTVAYADEISARGGRVYHIPAKSRGLFDHWRAMRHILKEHKEYKTVYFNVLDAGAAFTMLVPFLMGRKIVVHSHNDDTDKRRLHRLCRPALKLMSHSYAACSAGAAEHMFGAARDVLVVPNAIDAEKFVFNASVRERVRRELGIGDKLAVCHVGRISRQKNPLGLIDIFEAVHRKCPDSVLLSVGSGEMEEEYRQCIAAKGLADCVLCLGVRNDIPAILQAADVFLFPSLYEGLGIAVLEAQAAGLGCVVSDAVPQAVDATDLVAHIPLSAAPEVWADEIMRCLERHREDTYAQIKAAGYDISCCADFDKKLIAMFK